MSVMQSHPAAASKIPPLQTDIIGLRVKEFGEGVEFVLSDGEKISVSAELLWRECPSAQGKMRRISGRASSPAPGLRIVALKEVGRYAVNIAFSDGHDRGIYPWNYLAALGRRPKPEHFIMAEVTS